MISLRRSDESFYLGKSNVEPASMRIANAGNVVGDGDDRDKDSAGPAGIRRDAHCSSTSRRRASPSGSSAPGWADRYKARPGRGFRPAHTRRHGPRRIRAVAAPPSLSGCRRRGCCHRRRGCSGRPCDRPRWPRANSIRAHCRSRAPRGPPFEAISRCHRSSIDAKPRLLVLPPCFLSVMSHLPSQAGTVGRWSRFAARVWKTA